MSDQPATTTADAQGNPPPLEGAVCPFKWQGVHLAVTADGKLHTWSPTARRWSNAFTTNQQFEARRHLAAEVIALRALVESGYKDGYSAGHSKGMSCGHIFNYCRCHGDNGEWEHSETHKALTATTRGRRP